MFNFLFRKELSNDQEFESLKSYFPNATYEFRSQIPENSITIGRYSVLPFYKELEEELKLKNSKLINSYDQHLWIANMFDWAGQNGELYGFTPTAYSNVFEIKKKVLLWLKEQQIQENISGIPVCLQRQKQI